MTIFGVAGSVALLFTGLAVQHSISGINQRQFGDLVHYDLIVAHTDYVPASQQKKIDQLLAKKDVKEHTTIHYEQLTKAAGKANDTQQIKLIVPSDADTFNNYIRLINRQSQRKLSLQSNGVVISERLADLLGAKVGDTITLRDSNNTPRRMKVTGITEMYMGHFAFMSKTAYAQAFAKSFSTNADLVNLKDRSLRNTRKQSAQFMKLTGVAGVVQNTTLRSQISTIVNSLDKIMMVLIIVAGLLAIVILYNLTNINVSERMRELSTIKVLGFYDNEVTMYIYRETIILSLFGIIVGYGLGALLHRYILWAVPPDEVMFNPALGAMGFILPLIVVAVITLFLGFFVNHRLKNVDMLEALKSVD
jgi:putative ABC transport system permease protein